VASRDELLAQHRSMIEAIAHQMRREVGPSVDVRDLINEGVTGLFEADERFEDDRGIPFAAYARHRVRGAMADAVRRNGELTRRARDVVLRYAAAHAVLEGDEELRAETKAPEVDRSSKARGYADLMARVAAAFVLEAEAQLEGRANPEEALLTETQRQRVRDAVETLPETQRLVVQRLVHEGKRQVDVAEELGVTRVAVAKTYARACGVLRDKLR
jgi:RNA polymerase sigma factor for flagellar operon FliA